MHQHGILYKMYNIIAPECPLNLSPVIAAMSATAIVTPMGIGQGLHVTGVQHVCD